MNYEKSELFKKLNRAYEGVYIFFRDGEWYPIEFKNDKEAVENAECNPGTIRVETWYGRAVWPIKNKAAV